MFEILQSIRRRLDSSSSRPTHVVPLGVSCRVSYQARAFFGTRTSYPFDLWGTPIDGLTRYLSDPDPDRVYAADALEEVVVDGRITSIAAREFGFFLYHEFPREDVGLPGRVVAPRWREHIAKPRARHARQLERMLALDRPDHHILFVRDRLDVYGPRVAEGSAESVANLWSALSQRWSHAAIELLLVNIPCDSPEAQPGVHWANFEDTPDNPLEAWRGNSAGWTQAFASWQESIAK